MYLPGYNVKVIGKPIGGRGEPVVDGDLDNVCWENKPNEGPCPPDAIRGRDGLEDVPLPASEIFKPEKGAGRWGKQSQDRLNRRRQAATRKKFRKDAFGRNKPLKREDMLKAIEDGEVSSPEFLKKMRDMLDFRMLGREQARSFVQGATLAGGDKADPRSRLYDRPAILVWGKLYLPDGRPAGSFERVFFPEEGSVKHEYLQVDDRFKGSGIGGDFTAESEEIYPRAGFDKVKVTAALSEGPFIWAAKGFDWTDDKEREKFLDTLEIETMIEEQNLTDGDPLKYFDSKEEIDMVLELIDKARGQKFDDAERVRPIDFTFSKGVRNFLTDENVEKRSWNGIKYL